MELIISLDTTSKKPMYEQIYTHIKMSIQAGKLKAFDRLPSTRSLALHLNISRQTTQLSYDQLEAEGYIYALPYKGYFVSKIDQHMVMEIEEDVFLPKSKKEEVGEVIDFSPGGVDFSHFPYATFRKLSKNTYLEDDKEMFISGDPKGEYSFRQAIANYLYHARGVDTHAGNIIIGAGNEYLMMLLGLLLGKQTMAIENPSYKKAAKIGELVNWDICPIDMDESGIDICKLEGTKADIVYVMPANQFPTGILMPIGRRQALLTWANQVETRFIIEDDYDSEYRFRGKPIPALFGMGTRDNIIYMGTFSKAIAPAMRVSYMVLPAILLKKYEDKVAFLHSTVPRAEQRMLHAFLVEGYFERHINKMRSIYKMKHDVLLEEIKKLIPTAVVHATTAGLHIVLELQNIDEDIFIQRARMAGVIVYPMHAYYIDEKKTRGILLGFATVSIEKIRKGIGILACILKEKDENTEMVANT